MYKAQDGTGSATNPFALTVPLLSVLPSGHAAGIVWMNGWRMDGANTEVGHRGVALL